MHPLLGLDHLAAMLAVGIWCALAARLTGPELLWGPLGFANALLLGAVLGMQGVVLPAVEPMIAASLLVLGLLVASRLRLPGWLAAALVGSFAVFHGLAHGQELADSSSGFEALAGMLLATLGLHAAGLAVGWCMRGSGLWVGRMTGATVALLGGALLLQLS
jgi:urease accessory protein